MINSSNIIPAVEAYGFRVNLGTIEDYIAFIGRLISSREKACVFDHNLHSLSLYYGDSSIRSLYHNAVIKIDGMPIVLFLRLAGVRAKRSHRVTWVDFIWPLLEAANEEAWRIFWVGNSPDTLTMGLKRIQEKLPELLICGHDGYFDATPGSEDNRKLVAQINDFGADLCIVGMGMPRQERWVVQHRALIEAPAVLVAGACMEYVAGAVETPPRWMGQWGMEWCYRLVESPRRFGRRYLLEPWFVLAMILWHGLRP